MKECGHILGFVERFYDQTVSRIEDGVTSADSLGVQTIGPDSVSAPDYSDITQVFGQASYSPHDVVAHAVNTSTPLTLNLVYQSFVVVLLVAFGLLIVFYHKEMWQTFKMLGKKHIATRFSEEMGFLFSTFMRYINALGFMLMAVVTVKILNIYGFEFSDRLSVMNLLLVPIVSVTYAAIYFLQAGVLLAIGGITLSLQFTERMIMLKRVVFAATTVLTTPLVLLLAVNSGVSEITLFYAVILAIVLMTIVFAKKSISLFIEQNVSILLWFLYLCTVEVAPLAVLLTVALRYS